MTPRKAEIAELVRRGLTNREIANILHLSERTVEGHVLELMNLLGMTSRTQIATWWQTRDRDDGTVGPELRVALLMCDLLGIPDAPPSGSLAHRLVETWTEEVRHLGGRLLAEDLMPGKRLALFAGAADAAAAARGVHAAAARLTGPGQPRTIVHVIPGRRTGRPDPADLEACGALLDLAAPGQVLLTETAASILHDAPVQVQVRPLVAAGHGDGRAPLFEIQDASPGLPASPASSERNRTNVPHPISTFVGRRRELNELRRLLGQHRLVSLLGPGGCGKTRLALHLSLVTLDDYPHGTWLVDLGAIEDPRLVPRAVASAIGLREQRDQPLERTLREHLADRDILLLLDNADHLVDAVAHLADAILSGCPRIHLLVTSREPLGLSGELRYRVPGLSYPAIRRPSGLAEAETYSAIRLFLDRARSQDPAFDAAASGSVAAMCQICARLEGMPLAIELAAAWVPFIPLTEILDRLDNPFQLLTQGPRNAPARQQTLAATIDWSYDQLGREERALCCRMGAFVGSFTLVDVEAVCFEGEEETSRALHLMSGLAAKSLVQVDGGHLRLMETIREYSRLLLRQDGGLDAVAERHARHFLRLVQGDTRPDRRENWREQVDSALPNVRAAFAWALAHDPRAAADAAEALWDYWQVRGHIAEARQAVEALVRVVPGPEPARVQALTVAATVAYTQHDLAAGIPWADEALRLGRELSARRLTRAFLARGFLAMAAGDSAAAERYFEGALEAARSPERLVEDEARALNDLGIVLAHQGRLEDARRFLEQGLELRAAAGTADEGHVSRAFLAMTYLALGDMAAARASLRESLEAALRLQDRRAAWALGVAACVAAASSEHRRALVLAGAEASMHRSAGTVPISDWPRATGEWLAAARALEGAAATEARGGELGFDEAISLALAL